MQKKNLKLQMGMIQKRRERGAPAQYTDQHIKGDQVRSLSLGKPKKFFETFPNRQMS